jgi:hypothetical protein
MVDRAYQISPHYSYYTKGFSIVLEFEVARATGILQKINWKYEID